MLDALVRTIRTALTGVDEVADFEDLKSAQATVRESEEARESAHRILESYNSSRPSWESLAGRGSRDA